MSNGIDYPAMLADMEAKRDSLVASIANLRLKEMAMVLDPRRARGKVFR